MDKNESVLLLFQLDENIMVLVQNYRALEQSKIENNKNIYPAVKYLGQSDKVGWKYGKFFRLIKYVTSFQLNIFTMLLMCVSSNLHLFRKFYEKYEIWKIHDL